MDIQDQPLRVHVGFDHLRLESTLKQMAAATMPPIEAHRIGHLQPTHGLAQIGPRRFHQQMIMIGHETVGVEAHPELVNHLFERMQKTLAVLVIVEDCPPLVAPRHHVIDRTGKLNTYGSRHAPKIASLSLFCQVSRVDPVTNLISYGCNLGISDGGEVFAGSVSNGYTGFQIDVDDGTLYVTNGLGTGVLQVDGGSLSIDAGTVTADQLVLSDDIGASTFSFASGQLTSGGTFVTNGNEFVVGDGTDVATFQLAGGFHSFADGLTISSNSSVTGCGTIDGSVVVDPGGTILANCNGSLTFTDIVVNNGTLRAINGTVLEFYGPVVNNGLIDITGGTTNFHSTFINNGSIVGPAPAFQITGIAQQANNILITWLTSPGQTNELQATAGGAYSTNNFTPIFAVTNTVSATTNFPARYYRVRLVP
jgi:hypothetical protein